LAGVVTGARRLELQVRSAIDWTTICIV